MEQFRADILARVAQGESLDDAARAVGIAPASVWRALWKEAAFRDAYKHALWTNCQAQLQALEAQAQALQGDPDTADLADDFSLSERQIEMAIRARIADHASKRRHVMAMLSHWRWRCQNLAPSLFGDMPLEMLPDSETGQRGARFAAHAAN